MFTLTPPASGIALLKRLENCKLSAYLDDKGVPTIGWGHTKGVVIGDVCTQAQADAWLVDDCGWAWALVQKCIQVPLNENQGGALLAFAFNLGEPKFKTSTLVVLLNQGLYSKVPEQINRWVHETKPDGSVVVDQGLVNRCAAEVELWNFPVAA